MTKKNDPLLGSKHARVREIYRDDVLWVLDKAAGILSHPNPPSKRAANALIRAEYDPERELYRIAIPGERQRQVHLVHRLDQETSGLILCTFSAAAAARLREDFFHGAIEKEYRALVVGCPRAKSGEWSDHLRKTAHRGGVNVSVASGKPNAHTRFSVVERFDRANLALLALKPETGRTHQLRVQAASRHFPIAGDERYGDFAANAFLAGAIGLRHMFLHASRLRFRHPETSHLLRFEAPMTSRLSTPLERARELAKPVPRRVMSK